MNKEKKEEECSHKHIIQELPLKLLGFAQDKTIAVFFCEECVDYVITNFDPWNI